MHNSFCKVNIPKTDTQILKQGDLWKHPVPRAASDNPPDASMPQSFPRLNCFHLVCKGNQISETYYSAFYLHSFTNKTHWLSENCLAEILSLV